MDHKDRFEGAVRAACQRGTDWHVLAKLLYEQVDAAAAPREVAEIKSIAVDASGYTIGLLNRYVATYARTKLIADNVGLPVEELLAPVFNGVEAALKLSDYDAERGLHELRSLHAGKTTLAAIRAKLVEAKDLNVSNTKLQGSAIPHKLGDIRRDQRQMLIMKSLQRGWAPLSGAHSKIEFRRNDRLLSCDCLYRVQEYGLTIGVEIVDGGPAPAFNYVDSLLPSSIVRATFFNGYYMVFWTSDAAAHARRACRLLDWFGVHSIGVFIVEKDGAVSPLREAKGTSMDDDHDRAANLDTMIEGTHL